GSSKRLTGTRKRLRGFSRSAAARCTGRSSSTAWSPNRASPSGSEAGKGRRDRTRIRAPVEVRLGPLMRDLPLAARLDVWAVLATGILVLALFAPRHLAQPTLFFALLLLSSFASGLKVSLPLTKSGSTMSVSYAVDFASLLLLGADETMLVAAASAWSQCTFRMQSRNPPYRTLYSMASLVLTVKAAGLVYLALGGARPGEPFSLWAVPKPLVGAATAYFVCNTAFIASAIGLSTGLPVGKVWHENFLWSAPSY